MLHELEGLGAVPGLSSELPSLLRVALALDEAPLAQRIAAQAELVLPLDEHAIASARAQLAEAAGRHAEAARLYDEAAERWGGFGSVPERAYTLFGQGRCLVALGDPAGGERLAEAQALFASMGYKPALAETEALLAQQLAHTG
jgi:hypothetical protein